MSCGSSLPQLPFPNDVCAASLISAIPHRYNSVAVKLIHAMTDPSSDAPMASIRPNKEAFSACVSGAATLKDHRSAVMLLNQAIRLGIRPDSIFLNGVLASHTRENVAKENNLRDRHESLQDILESALPVWELLKGKRPNEQSYLCMVNIFLQAGDVDGALQIRNGMKKKSEIVDVTLANEFAKAEDWKRMEETMQRV